MTDEKNMPEETSQSLDEMLDQIIDNDIDGDTDTSANTPVINADVDTQDAPEDVKDTAKIAEEKKPIDWENLDDDQLSELMSSEDGITESEKAADQKRRQMLWMIFGIAVILAIILPAGYVFIKARGIASNTPTQEPIITPVNNATPGKSAEASSTEATKTAATVTEEKTEEAEYREVELEEWNYYVHGFNIFAPARGPRVKAADGINPIYKATVYDALDIYINKANGVQITVPQIAGTSTDGAEGTANNLADDAQAAVDSLNNASSSSSASSGAGTTATRIYLDAIGTNDTDKVAVWTIGKTSYQTSVGDTIGSTGWKVTKITDSTATIQNGSKSYTLRVGGSAKN